VQKSSVFYCQEGRGMKQILIQGLASIGLFKVRILADDAKGIISRISLFANLPQFAC